MLGDSEILTWIFLAFVALLFVMIFWTVLGAPRKSRRQRRPFAGDNAPDSGVSDEGARSAAHRGRHREDIHDGGGDDAGSDGGGGDGGGD